MFCQHVGFLSHAPKVQPGAHQNPRMHWWRTFHSLTVLSFVDRSMRVLFELRHQRTLLIFSSISSDLR